MFKTFIARLPFALSTASTIALSASGSANRWSVPATIKADSESALLGRSSWLSGKGTVSSAGECKMVVVGLTVVALPLAAGSSSHCMR